MIADEPFTDDDLATFEREGWIGPVRLYEPDEMKTLWRAERLALLDRSHAVYRANATSGVTNIANYDRHLDSDWLAQHVCHPRIVERMRRILGPDVLCWRSEFFPKYPGDEGTDWHQADTFANVSGKPQIVWPGRNRDFGGTVTVWTALTPSTIETGCLQFVPGTHETMHYDETKPIAYRPDQVNAVVKDGEARGFFGYDYRELQIDPGWKPDTGRAVSIELQPGESVIFWSTLLHASHPHLGRTRAPRIGFASRYVPAAVQVYPGLDNVEEYGGRISLDDYGAVVVAGRDRFGHNRLRTHTTRGVPFAVDRTALEDRRAG